MYVCVGGFRLMCAGGAAQQAGDVLPFVHHKYVRDTCVWVLRPHAGVHMRACLSLLAPSSLQRAVLPCCHTTAPLRPAPPPARTRASGPLQTRVGTACGSGCVTVCELNLCYRCTSVRVFSQVLLCTRCAPWCHVACVFGARLSLSSVHFRVL